jgi:hypothetical protein
MSECTQHRCGRRVRLDSPLRLRRRATSIMRDALVGARDPSDALALIQALATLRSMLPPPAEQGERP